MTELKVAALKAHTEFLMSVVESLPYPFFVVDATNYSIRLANQAADDGVPAEDTKCYALTHGRSGPCSSKDHPCPVEIVKKTKKPVTVEHAHYDRQGRPRYVEVHGYPIFDERGNVAQIIESMVDVTDRKRMEGEFRRAKEELETRVQERTADLNKYVARLESKNRELQDFLRAASHDLQEPLRKVEIFEDLVARALGRRLSEMERDYLRRLRGAVRSMRAMIRGLLAYSRVSSQALVFEPIDLRQIVEEIEKDLGASLDQSLVVEIGDLPEIEADLVQISDLLRNLIINAIRYSKEGQAPRVTISARKFSREESKNDGWVELCVQDDGIGFDMQYRDQLFRPFGRLHGRDYEGAGMGLATCRKIVERHEGEITAQSRLGGGATFIILLPLRQKPS